MNELLDLWDTLDKIHTSAHGNQNPVAQLDSAKARLAREAMIVSSGQSAHYRGLKLRTIRIDQI